MRWILPGLATLCLASGCAAAADNALRNAAWDQAPPVARAPCAVGAAGTQTQLIEHDQEARTGKVRICEVVDMHCTRPYDYMGWECSMVDTRQTRGGSGSGQGKTKPGCGSDQDCKGDRVCEKGKCVNP